MNDLHKAAQQALAFTMRDFASLRDFEAAKAVLHDNLRAALAQQDEPVAWIYQNMYTEQEYLVWKKGTGGRNWTPLYTAPPQRPPQTIDEAMQQPRAMAQAYENGYKAGVANEREACAKVCESRFMGDLTREDMEARRCAAAIRARGNT